MRKFILLGAVALAFAIAMMTGVGAQTNPFFIVQNPQGLHITAGTVFPTAATIGALPGDGAIHIDLNRATSNPAIFIYSYSAAAWIPFSPIGAGVGSVPSTLATNAVEVVNSVWGGTNQFVFEGTVADANETIITAANTVTGDVTVSIPIDNATWDGAGTFMFSDLITNAPEAANSIWGESNNLVWEGAVADGGELRILWTNSVADVTLTVPADNAFWAGTGAPVITTLIGNAPGIATAITLAADTIIFEGATGGDGFQMIVDVEDPVAADRTWVINDPDADAAFVLSLLATNAPDANNSIWLDTNMIVFEGATGVNAFEINLQPEDSTVADDTYLLLDRGLAADNHELIAVPDITWTTGNLFWDADVIPPAAALANADNAMIVQRIYIPHRVTVTNVDVTTIALANGSAGDNTIAVAIYYDDDAGAQIVELVNPTDNGAGNVSQLETLNIADTTLNPGWYRIAFCAQDATDHDLEGDVIHADSLLFLSAGAAAGEMYSTGTACTAGDPAGTTGVLTASGSAAQFMLRVQ